MKNRLLSCILAISMLAGLFPWYAGGSADALGRNTYTIEDYENNELLAVYDNGDAEVFSYSSMEELEAGISDVGSMDGVKWVQPNFVYEDAGDSVNDPYFYRQWAMSNDGSFSLAGVGESSGASGGINKYPFDPSGGGSQSDILSSYPALSVSGIDINISAAWEQYKAKREVVVAVIDTGIDYNHKDFGDVFWTNSGEIPDNGEDDDGNGFVDDYYGWNFYGRRDTIFIGDEDSHGTHCAGTIAASANNGQGVAGIVGDGSVKLMTLKVLGGSKGRGTTASLIKGIKYAEDNGASIVNLSMGTDSYDKALYQVIADSSMLFVVAAGNDGQSVAASPSYPAAFDLDNIISVANIMYNGELASTSNYGAEYVDIAAPGTFVLSLSAYDTYSYMTGTSMSAPMVTGVAAMLYAQYDAITLGDVKSIILKSAKGLDTLDGLVASGGILDAGAAMTLGESYQDKRTRTEYYDLAGHWAEEYAYAAVKAGLFNGTDTNTFSPENTMTRAMAVTVLYRLAGTPETSGQGEEFTDVEAGQWYSTAVRWASENGIVSGYGDGIFGLSDSITRQQLAVMLYNYARYAGFANLDSVADLSAYADSGSIAEWAQDALSWANGTGLINGRTEDTIAPNDTATRAECAAILVRMLDKIS